MKRSYGSYDPQGWAASSRDSSRTATADAGWIVQLTESFLGRGNTDGTLHRNALGHDLYGAKIYEHLKADLYDRGNLDSPREPA
jgi:hypothetical protein